MNEPMPCPYCSCTDPQEIKFTWWGGLLGPKMLHHVKCMQCGKAYNSKTGRSNARAITIYVIVSSIIVIGLLVLLRSSWG